MDPTERLLRVRADVTNTMTAHRIPFDSDLSKIFSSDLGLDLALFEALLDDIENTINHDRQLFLAHPFHWRSILPAPKPPHKTFSLFYRERSINMLVVAIDSIIGHSLYMS